MWAKFKSTEINRGVLVTVSDLRIRTHVPMQKEMMFFKGTFILKL